MNVFSPQSEATPALYKPCKCSRLVFLPSFDGCLHDTRDKVATRLVGYTLLMYSYYRYSRYVDKDLLDALINTLPGDWRLVWKRLITLQRKSTQDGMFRQHRCRLGGIWDDERRLEAKQFPLLSVECDKVVPGRGENIRM